MTGTVTSVASEAADFVYGAVTFRDKETYLGLPQLKAYYNVWIHFKFKTLESDGLLMYNDGRGDDFLAVELVDGHLR